MEHKFIVQNKKFVSFTNFKQAICFALCMKQDITSYLDPNGGWISFKNKWLWNSRKEYDEFMNNYTVEERTIIYVLMGKFKRA